MLVKMASLLHGVRGINEGAHRSNTLVSSKFLKSSQYRKRYATMLLFSSHEILKQVFAYKNLDLSFGFSLHQRQILVQKYVANSKPLVIY